MPFLLKGTPNDFLKLDPFILSEANACPELAEGNPFQARGTGRLQANSHHRLRVLLSFCNMVFRRLPESLLISLLCLGTSFPSSAQSPLSNLLQSSPAAGTSSTPADPLGRSTPQSTVLGFLHAAQAGDYSIAAQYLQMSAASPRASHWRTSSILC